jgi:hypothetical protein
MIVSCPVAHYTPELAFFIALQISRMNYHPHFFSLFEAKPVQRCEPFQVNFIIPQVDENDLQIPSAPCLSPNQSLALPRVSRKRRTRMLNDILGLDIADPVLADVLAIPRSPLVN